jgi:hypothetical protein
MRMPNPGIEASHSSVVPERGGFAFRITVSVSSTRGIVCFFFQPASNARELVVKLEEAQGYHIEKDG